MKKRSPPTKKKDATEWQTTMAGIAAVLEVPLAEIKRAKNGGCAGFRRNGAAHVPTVGAWLTENPRKQRESKVKNLLDMRELKSLGAGPALKRLQEYEAASHAEFMELLESDEATADERRESVNAWLKGSRELFRYEMNIEMAKRDAGELIPREEVVEHARAFLAWHQVGLSDAIRTAVPRIVGLEKPGDVAHIIDPIIRESQALAFDIGTRAGLVPSWLAEAAMNQKPTTPP